MNHPTHEDWMSFLYGEDSPERRDELERHLNSCPACASRVNAWRSSAHALEAWKLPPARPVAAGNAIAATPWKWAAAAIFVLGLGMAIGRFIPGAGPDVGGWRASLLREFDQHIAEARAEWMAEQQNRERETPAQLLAAYAREQEQQRLQDRESLVVTLRQFDTKYAASLALLRKELETVAVNTQDGFTETEQRLGQLASFRQPTAPAP